MIFITRPLKLGDYNDRSWIKIQFWQKLHLSHTHIVNLNNVRIACNIFLLLNSFTWYKQIIFISCFVLVNHLTVYYRMNWKHTQPYSIHLNLLNQGFWLKKGIWIKPTMWFSCLQNHSLQMYVLLNKQK